MKATVLCAVLIWWFALLNGPGAGRVIGPFGSQEDCERIRTEWAGNNRRSTGYATVCWNDGRR